MSTEAIKTLTIWLATGTEVVAGLLIAVAVAEATVRTILALPATFASGNPGNGHEAKEQIRLRLGRWLALALEFELGADVLRTAGGRCGADRGLPAAIAAVRTALNYFLQKEIDAATGRAKPQIEPPSTM